MTPEERELWIQVKADYEHALKIAIVAWTDAKVPATAESLQASTATILIHLKELRRAALPHNAPASGNDLPTPAAAPKACPDCNGPMWDNRGDKKNPRSPDFKCKDADCGKGVWLTAPKKKSAA